MARPRLFNRMAEGEQGRLTLVSAPPGYGKTTLVSHWVQQSGAPHAWLSLDEHDAGLVTFVSYFVGAVRTVYPEALAAAAALLETSPVSDPLRLADIVLADLESLPGPIILALDDFHAVQSQPVLAFLDRVVQHLPADVHLVLISRSDPLLPLAQLRGRGQITEIRTSDLRFSEAEARALIEGVTGRQLPGEVAALLAERTEGWPVGLQLASLSLRESQDPLGLVQRFAASSDRLVAEYLVSEVLGRLPDRQRRLLVRMSVLDRVCGALCEAISEGELQPGEGNAVLAAMWGANLFLIALDGEGRWHRFHHLFLELLRRELPQLYTEQEIAAMRLRACAWCESQGLIEEAIGYAVQAGDDGQAAGLVDAHLHEALNREDSRRLDGWLQALPESVLGRPDILIAQAFRELLRARYDVMFTLAEAAEAELETGRGDHTPAQLQAWLGAINALRSIHAYTGGRAADCMAYAGLALQQLPPEMIYARSQAELYYLFSLEMTGRRREAIAAAEAALGAQAGRRDARTGRLMLALASTHYTTADLPALFAIVASYRRFAAEGGFRFSLGWANFGLGWVHYQRNELAAAEACFRAVADDRYAVVGRCAIDGLTGLALTLHAQGRGQEAHLVVDELRRLITDRGMLPSAPIADALALRLRLDRGEPPGIEWPTSDALGQPTPDLWITPDMVAARAHAFSGSAERLDAAALLLGRCREAAELRHSERWLIEIGSTEALLHQARGDEAAALAALREAVRLGETGGALRLIADAGPRLAPLLRRLQSEGVAPAYVARILAVISPHQLAPPETRLPPPRREPGDLLTNRELDVLLLLERRMTNKEIAERLNVTPDTVNKHAISIFKKLGADNRRQAVARARDLGILSPSPSTP